eukprot:m.253114 g.253114  ORF g.253114 m.253114 type:complete len:323 (-) comp19130_c0_seq12:3228-4196(-)
MEPAVFWAVMVMCAITGLVVLPLLFEVVFTILEGCGFTRLRYHRNSIRVAHWVSVVSDKAEYGVAVLTAGMIVMPIYIHFSLLLPFFAGVQDALHGESLTHVILLHLLPSVWINSNMLFHFYKAATLPGGKVKAGLGELRTSEEGGRWCRVCVASKPAGVSHCSTCGKCCNEMDHHCPFTANCVGADNYRYFFLFVTWAFVATIYAVWLTVHPYFHCHEVQENSGHALETHCQTYGRDERRIVVLACCAFAVVGGFWVFCVILLLTGRYTKDFMLRKPKYEDADTARPMARAQRRLGPANWWWVFVLPPIPMLYGKIPAYTP